MDTEVCIIGAGATGLAAAHLIASTGVRCAVVDMLSPGCGATFNCAGVLHSGARYAVADAALAASCWKAHRDTMQNRPFVVADPISAFYVVTSDEEELYAARLLAMCAEIGIPAETVGAREVREREPLVTPAVRFAVSVPDYAMDPVLLVSAYLEDLDRQNIAVLSATVLQGGDYNGDRWYLRFLGPDGPIVAHARCVFVAAGAWSASVLQRLGCPLDMRYVSGVMLVDDQKYVGRIISRCAEPSTGDSIIPCYGSTLFGSTWQVQDGPEPTLPSSDECLAVMDEVRTLVPSAPRQILRSISGVRPVLSSSEPTRATHREFHMIENFGGRPHSGVAVFGGKLTLHRSMAEAGIRALGLDHAVLGPTPFLQQPRAKPETTLASPR
jgi:glycerol-3-phosphate dehydrogenase